MTAFDDKDREAIGALADLLIPAAHGMPSATEVELHGQWIDRAVHARPEIAELLRPAVDAARAQGAAAALDSLKASDPDSLEVFFGVVTACYYMHPGVRKRLSYPGQSALPISEGEAEYYLEDGLLDPVIARGPVYRDAGDGSLQADVAAGR